MEETNTFLDHINNPESKSRGEREKRSLGKMLKGKIVGSLTKKTLYRRLPVLKWMSEYRWSMLVSDVLAGLTVGLTAIPQGIAYAVVAGLEPQYGLYSGFMGCFVYFFLGSVKDITIGPTAIMALMAQKSVESYGSDFAVLLCFLTGCIILLLGILHLGFLVRFISVPVIVGFTSAAAITIASSQLKGLLGIGGKSNDFLESWISVFEHIRETRYEDLCLGLVTIAFLVMTKRVNERVSGRLKRRRDVGKWWKFYGGSWRVLALGRNAVAVVLGALASYSFEVQGMNPFRLTGNVEGGLPRFNPPPFWSTIRENNSTRVVEFDEMVRILGTGMLSVPMISVLETIAIAKAFAKGKSLDATQEMIALGVSNVAGSFFRSMPTAGSFTRTAVNNASGVKTPLGGIFTGAVVLLALTLTATFKYIPKATLAAVIITAMFYMVEYHEIMLIWKVKQYSYSEYTSIEDCRTESLHSPTATATAGFQLIPDFLSGLDFLPLSATVLACLILGLDYGILVGISVNLLFLLHAAVRPKISQQEPLGLKEEVVVIRPEQTISYAGAEYMREWIVKGSRAKGRAVVVIDGRNVYSVDSTIAKNLKTLAEDLEKSGQDFIFWNWPSSPRETCLRLDPNLHKYFHSADTLEDLLELRNKCTEVA